MLIGPGIEKYSSQVYLADQGDVVTSVRHFKVLSDCLLQGQDQIRVPSHTFAS